MNGIRRRDELLPFNSTPLSYPICIHWKTSPLNVSKSVLKDVTLSCTLAGQCLACFPRIFSDSIYDYVSIGLESNTANKVIERAGDCPITSWG